MNLFHRWRSVLKVVTAVVMSVGALVILLLMWAFDDDMGDFNAPLIHGFRLSSTSGHEMEIYSLGSSDLGISSKVTHIAMDERVILVKRQALKPRGDSIINTYLVPVPDTFDFWIIDAEKPVRLGPFPESEFEAKVRELNLQHLKFKPAGVFDSGSP